MSSPTLDAVRAQAEEWAGQQASAVKVHCGRRLLELLGDTPSAVVSPVVAADASPAERSYYVAGLLAAVEEVRTERRWQTSLHVRRRPINARERTEVLERVLLGHVARLTEQSVDQDEVSRG